MDIYNNPKAHIRELNLSQKVINTLLLYGIDKIEDLENVSSEFLQSIQHLTNRDYNEVVEKLEKYGIVLKSDANFY